MFLVIMAILLITLGVVKIIDKHVAYTPVEGICVEVSLKRRNRGLGYGSKGTFGYVYNGKQYIFRERMYPGSKKRKQGDRCILYINKKNPSKCLTPSDNDTIRELFIAGALMIFVSVL